MSAKDFTSAGSCEYILRTFSLSLLTITAIALSPQAYADNIRVRTETIRIDSSIPGLRLALHHEFSAVQSFSRRPKPIVLFAEGSAVPTAGNAGFRIDGLSWMDYLAKHGFDVWSLDYLGLGESSRYSETDMAPPRGRASDCASQQALTTHVDDVIRA